MITSSTLALQAAQLATNNIMRQTRATYANASICNRDCLSCVYQDCVCDEMTAEDYRVVRELEDYISPKTAEQKARARNNRKYYQRHKEALDARHREHYRKNKEAIAAYQREYRQQNKEALAAYQREYRQRNKEALAAYRREYYQKHKSKEVSK